MAAAADRLNAAVKATVGGRYRKALEGFLWFHRHAREDPELRGVRQSFALGYWSDLADVYPPALEAMKQARSEALSIVADESRSAAERADAFNDVEGLNRQLSLERATVALYRRLTEEAPEVADRCGRWALEAVIASGDAPLARRALGTDPEAAVRRKAVGLSEAVAEPDPRFHRMLLRDYLHTIGQIEMVLRLADEADAVPHLHAVAIELTPPALRPKVKASLTAADP
jgi:hypothetical protein